MSVRLAGSQLLQLAAGLADPEQRRDAATTLARALGGEELLLFAPDPELGVLLPAPGLPQALRGAGEWRQFLEAGARDEEVAGTLTGSEGEARPARGCILPDGTAAVLLGAGPDAPGPGALRPLLPLLGALFRSERQVVADEVRVRAAADAVERAHALTRALQTMRRRVEDALVEAQKARAEARERAEQAEDLATELQSQAERLHEQAVELEILNDALTARTEEAERARAAADEANRAKSEFLANMSHELRTPINAVIGYAELLSMGIGGPVSESQRTQLQRIQASSSHLLSLVNDVLDLAKVEAGRMTVACEREPAAKVIGESVALIEGAAAARSLVLENECRDLHGSYVGDRDRVRQILVNLLSNAVKFTAPGGRVTVRGGSSERTADGAQVNGDGPWMFITVEDSGIGMSPDQLSRVFRPFVQAESGHTRTRGGTGLGLTISRQLARLMGGDLSVSSVQGKGSRFTLWLPADSPASGSLDPTIRVGGEAAANPHPAGLSAVGERIRHELSTITSVFAERVRAEIALDTVDTLGECEILGQVPVLVVDLAGMLVRIDRAGGDPGLLREASEVQRLLARQHGTDRGRRDWPPHAVRQEYEILREELLAVARRAATDAPTVDLDGVAGVVDRLLEAARRWSLRSHGAASLGAGGA